MSVTGLMSCYAAEEPHRRLGDTNVYVLHTYDIMSNLGLLFAVFLRQVQVNKVFCCPVRVREEEWWSHGGECRC
jgi:hypothetical protein